MPYRVRPLNWNLLVNPTMRGLEMEARASENMSRSVLGGLASVGQGIVRNRREKEDNRRFDETQALREDALDLRRDQFRADAANDLLDYEQTQTDLREKQAISAQIMRGLGITTQAINESGGEPSQDVVQAHQTLVDMAGGGAAVAETLNDPRAANLFQKPT